jgi:hypothetical protein
MKLIIAGSRYLTNVKYLDMIDDLIKQNNLDPKEIVSGTARGIDTLGEIWARENGVPVVRFPADWNTYGKAAGLIRNSQMAEYGTALLVIRLEHSKGSRSMLECATRAGLSPIIDVVTSSN